MTSIAVLGTGTMGAPMARSLLRAGFEVRVWNPTRAKAEPLAQNGAYVADSPAEAVRDVEFVLTMPPDGPAVEETMFGRGAADAMRDDAVWIQSSTVGVAAADRLGELAREHGITYVDAPVLGTKDPAERGELVILASGPEDVRVRCQPVFGALGRKIVWLGDAGAGSRMKMVTNLWLVALIEGAAESIALAQALDLEPRQFLQIIEGGHLDSPYLQLKGRAMIEQRFEPSFKLRLARKDVGLILDAAQAAGADLPLAETVRGTFDRAIELGHGDEDVAAAYYGTAEARAGGSVRAG
jgi:3-hydroxyisobutyrate dehydrogenase